MVNYEPYIARLKREKAKERKLAADRRKQALQAAKQIAALLKQKFGAEQVFVFGSTLSEEYFRLHSDIDIAVKGLTAENFFRAYYEAYYADHGFKVDLIDLRTCSDFLKRKIIQEGREL
ncbi:MAG: nucleotidyltransferase family protein [bacterium]